MASVQPEFRDCGTQVDDCFPEGLLLVGPDEVKWHLRQPKAVQRAILAERVQDGEVGIPTLPQDHPPLGDAEVERTDVLERSPGDHWGGFIKPLDAVDSEMAAEQRLGGVTKIV